MNNKEVKNMNVIKKIGVMSLGKVFAVLYAILGLIVGVFMTLFSLIGAAVGMQESTSMLGGAIVGIFSIILVPIIYGAMGFVSGLIMALLYNLVASWVGGLEVEIN